jgi:nucleotide-binding universal stress UspA family protein
MYQRILIATDGSELSSKAVESGIALAALCGAELVALQVIPRYPVSYFEGGANVPNEEVARIEKQWAEAAQKAVEAVKASAQAKGVKAKAITAHSDMVAEAIIAAAQKNECDLIVMASHGRRGFSRILLGSETTHVLTHSHVPVLVLR